MYKGLKLNLTHTQRGKANTNLTVYVWWGSGEVVTYTKRDNVFY